MHTLRVVLALGPLALSFLRDSWRWFWWGAGIKRTPEFHRRRAEHLVRTIVRLGPSFVKIAQVFASRADLIPEPYLAELGTLVDQVAPLPFESVRATIREAYGREVDEIFDDFERAPVASASLAQVHRARYKGESVAVKVLRPGVEANVAADIIAFRRILNWLDRWWGHHHIKRELTALAAFEVRVREEVDFRQEAAYATQIRKNFEGNTHVMIPRIVDELIRQRVLVMEFLEGTRVDRLDPATANPKRIVQTLVELYIQMELIDGLFHADPHPGNVLVAPDGRLILLDFGAVVTVPLAMRRALVHTSIAAIRKDADGVTHGFMGLGLVPPGVQAKDVRWIADLLIASAYTKTTSRQRLDMMLADRVMKTLFDSPIALTQEAVYFGRAAALIEGIGTRYDPYFQIVPVASPVVLRMRSRILSSLGESVSPNMDEMATMAGYAAGRAARWMADWVGGVRDRVTSRFTNGDDDTSENGECAGEGPIRAIARISSVLLLVVGLTACARMTASVVTPSPIRSPQSSPFSSPDPFPMRPELAKAIETRIADLKSRGGACQAYGEVLEKSHASGRIMLRPYMWRVQGALAAGAATESGELTTAVAIDSLNIGVRTIDDVLRSIEHEAAHVAFQLPSRDAANEREIERRVNECSPTTKPGLWN